MPPMVHVSFVSSKLQNERRFFTRMDSPCSRLGGKASQVVRVALLFTAFPVWIIVAKSNRKAVLPKNVQTTQTTPTTFSVPQLHSSFQEHSSVCLASKQSLAAAGKVSPTRMPLEEGRTGLKTYVSIFLSFPL